MCKQHFLPIGITAVVFAVAGATVTLLPPNDAKRSVQTIADDQIYNEGSSAPEVSYSLVEGGLSAGVVDGGSNLEEAPLFVDRDGLDKIPGSVDDVVSLVNSSPGVNAGSNADLPADIFDLDDDGDTTEPIPTDITGAARTFDNGSAQPLVDMGAYETDATGTAIDPFPSAPATGIEIVKPYPNPVRNSARFEFSIPHTEEVEVSVYDVLGRKLIVLFDEVARGNEKQTVEIDARRLPSGVYFIQVSSGTHRETLDFTVVR